MAFDDLSAVDLLAVVLIRLLQDGLQIPDLSDLVADYISKC